VKNILDEVKMREIHLEAHKDPLFLKNDQFVP
jgi:hypothetical protein